MITTAEIFDANETIEDTHEFVSSIFSIEEDLILNPDLYPIDRLNKLNETRKKADQESLETSEDKELHFRIIETINKNYLIKIFQDLLDLDIYEYDFNASLKNNILYILQKNTTYFDTLSARSPLDLEKKLSFNERLKELFRDKDEFNYTFTEPEKDYKNKRNLTIKECFNGDNKKYLDFFREKILSVSPTIWKHLLIQELKKLDLESSKTILTYLMQTHVQCTYINRDSKQMKKAELFFNSNHWGNLLIKDQKSFYLSLQLIFNKLKESNFREDELTEYNKNIVQTLIWLKSSPKESLEILEILTELYKREKSFALNKPNNLILHLHNVKDRIGKEIKKKTEPPYTTSFDNLAITNEMLIARNICNAITERVTLICTEVLADEELLIKEKIKTERNNQLKKLSKNLIYLAIVFFLLGTIWFGYYYFFNIESIYKNSFQKNTKLAMESTPYLTDLKDSLDPIKNETNQRLRLDHINNLNSRYFKVLSIFLNPELTDKEIGSSLPSLNIPKSIKNIDSINIIRDSISKIFSKEEWKSAIEPMLGPNVLTELRAYGAISDFLVPSLAHYVIIDDNGQPLKVNRKIQVFSPHSEKEGLRKTLIAKLGKAPDDTLTEPKYYIDNFDSNYINIKNTVELLLSKITGLKEITTNEYNKASSKEEKFKLKKTLQGIALAEVRLLDLKSKIQLRHDYIVAKNTYRAPLEQ